MFLTDKTVTSLKPIAIIVGLAITLWSFGLPTLHFVGAANITTVSDTLSDSAPSASSTHEIVFTTPTGVAAGETIVIEFNGNFNPSSLDEDDVDLATTSDYVLVANGAESGNEWGVLTDATSITFTSDTAVIAPNATVTIEIGTNATFGTTGNTNIVNPGSEGSYEIDFTVGSQDSGSTRVVIIDSVVVSAAVDTIFTFAVSGVDAGTAVNGSNTTGTTSTTTIEFGMLEDGVATTTAQNLVVNTNATNGYVVTVQVDAALRSSTGADIDGFDDGSDSDTPTVWDSPTGTVGLENTYGHWGFTSTDDDTTRDAGDEFNVANEYAAASTTPRVVMSHDGPANGTGNGEGTALVGYRVEISALQEAGDDYSATLTYVATPVF